MKVLKRKEGKKVKKRAVIDRKASLKGLEVIGKGELNSEILKNLGPLPEFDPGKPKFKKVKDGAIEKGSLNNAFKQFSERSLNAVQVKNYPLVPWV